MADEEIEKLLRDESNNRQTRLATRATIRDVDNLIDTSEHRLNDIHCDEFDIALTQVKAAGADALLPRELQMQCGIQNRLVAHVRNQAEALGDVSANFNWDSLTMCLKEVYQKSDGGLDWTRFGQEARMTFTCMPMYNVMLGAIQQEEKIRKVAQRRRREDLSGVEYQTGKEVDNNQDGDDKNDEATNARITRMTDYFDSLGDGAEVDLLRVLVDPENPVQTVENFFDYSNLHVRKRVANFLDESTGLLMGKYWKTDSNLEDREKKQMVVALKMKDLKDLAKLLYGEEAGGSDSSSSRSSQSSAPQAMSQASTSTAFAPLHRDDPLYHTQTAIAQVELLTQRAAAASQTQPSQASSQPTAPPRSSSSSSSSSSATVAQKKNTTTKKSSSALQDITVSSSGDQHSNGRNRKPNSRHNEKDTTNTNKSRRSSASSSSSTADTTAAATVGLGKENHLNQGEEQQHEEEEKEEEEEEEEQEVEQEEEGQDLSPNVEQKRPAVKSDPTITAEGKAGKPSKRLRLLHEEGGSRPGSQKKQKKRQQAEEEEEEEEEGAEAVVPAAATASARHTTATTAASTATMNGRTSSSRRGSLKAKSVGKPSRGDVVDLVDVDV